MKTYNPEMKGFSVADDIGLNMAIPGVKARYIQHYQVLLVISKVACQHKK